MQAMADGTGSHTKMGTWAVDEREAELCELIADQDEKWDESLVGKEQWINMPAQPPGLLRSGMVHSLASCVAPFLLDTVHSSNAPLQEEVCFCSDLCHMCVVMQLQHQHVCAAVHSGLPCECLHVSELSIFSRAC